MFQIQTLSTSPADKVYSLQFSVPQMPRLSQLISILKYPSELVNQYCPHLLEKIYEVGKYAIFTGISGALYWANPSILAMGFITGIIFDEGVDEVIRKIKAIWRTQVRTSCLILGISSFLGLQVTLAAGSFLCGAYLGKRLSLEAKKITLIGEGEKPRMPPVNGIC